MNRLHLVLLSLLSACHSDAPPRRTMPVSSQAVSNLGPEDWDDDDAGGIGAIETRSAAGDVGRLRLASVHVTATQAGDWAEVQVEHHFVSDAEVPLEGTFRLPLPDRAIVTGLSMTVDGKTVEGELVDNARARKIYQEIVDSMQDPAVMEWEHGSTFKMRVFPIEPKKDKVVTLRYLAPLRVRHGALRFVQGTHTIDGETAPVTMTWNGKTTSAKEALVELPADEVPRALREDRADATYQAVRIRPDWTRVPDEKTVAPKRWLVVVDTSRSTLEERKLELETLRAVLPSLGTFSIATSDLDTHLAPQGFVSATSAHIDDALRFVEQTPSDGATDLGQMMRVAGDAARGEPTGVVYVGDCEPSWGQTDATALVAEATRSLGGAPFYPLLVGASVDGDLARVLASATGGRVLRAQRHKDLSRLSTALHARTKRLVNVAFSPIAGSVVLGGDTTLDEGDELTALVRTPKGGPVPKTLELSANGYTSTLALDGRPAAMVARRYGAALVHSLEQAGKKEEVIAASIEYSVMSKQTSFLVLDSDEAYERFHIERRAKEANAPRVDALASESADISADRVQPGDPEIEIDAPRDAERVFVVLPTGDVKIAAYDEEANGGRGAWLVRFLVDNGTAEGVYQARAFIDHRDGTHETRTVSYTVDTTAPTLSARIGRVGDAYQIDVHQVGERGLIDLSRVEIVAPDGQTVVVKMLRWGVYRAHWKPTRDVTGETVHIIGVDQALNHTALDLMVQ